MLIGLEEEDQPELRTRNRLAALHSIFSLTSSSHAPLTAFDAHFTPAVPEGRSGLD